MLAAEVIADKWLDEGVYSGEDVEVALTDAQEYYVDALLAHGSEHGVAILADGTLRPLTEGEATT